MRTIEFKLSDYTKWETGMFHQWGLIEQNEISITVGIVEATAGRVHTVHPYNIRFTDKANETV